MRKVFFAACILLPGLLCGQLFGDFSLSFRGGLSRYSPLFPPSEIPLPSQYALRVGIGFGGVENYPFCGAVAITLLPVTDTFPAEGYVDQWWNSVYATGHRTTRGFGFHFPINIGFYNNGFFTAYGGLSIGFIVGSSTYNYTDLSGQEVEPLSDYPAPGKTKIRCFPGSIEAGAMYEFEKFTPYAEAGFTFGGLTHIPGLNEGWYTLEAGVLLHLDQ